MAVKFHDISFTIKDLQCCTGNLILTCDVNLADLDFRLHIIDQQCITIPTSCCINSSILFDAESSINCQSIAIRSRDLTQGVFCTDFESFDFMCSCTGSPLFNDLIPFQYLDHCTGKLVRAVDILLAYLDYSLSIGDRSSVCYALCCGSCVSGISGRLLYGIINLHTTVILRKILECCRPGFTLTVLIHFSVQGHCLLGGISALAQRKYYRSSLGRCR